MNNEKIKRIGKLAVKSFLAIAIIGSVGLPFLSADLKEPGNPLSHKEITKFDSYVTKVFTSEGEFEQNPSPEDLLSSIQRFVATPEGGVQWRAFGETGQTPYSYTDEDGEEWGGVRPEFTQDLKNLDGTEIIIQGYMFPLDQQEKQSIFLIGPFPISCPYHYHVTPNLIIEAHTKTPLAFSYDAINIKGKLELVPEDDEYNVFYRLKNVEIVK